MAVINVYTSNPADQGLQALALALGHNLCRPVQLLPLSKMPRPDELARQRNTNLRRELLEAIALAEHDLDRHLYGEQPRDAGRENGLIADLQALRNRLSGVESVLLLGKGGLDNA